MNKKFQKVTKQELFITGGLILLSLIPMLAGAFRIVELSSGAEVTPENARFFASPIPVVTHIIASILFSIIGAFQFAPSFRRFKRGWHQTLGKWLLVPNGLAVAISGLWMTLFYPWPDGDGVILYGMRLLVGTAMFLFIILGIFAVRQRNFKLHGDWMLRGYALGLGAGTQVLTHIPAIIFPNLEGELPRAMMMGAGWVINIAVAEWVIHKKKRQRTRHKKQSSIIA